MQVSIPTISITDALKEDAIFIDVRSPGEYEEFHIPNAISVPLFSNEERAQVGTTYKQIGQGKAIELGVQIFSKKLPEYYQTFKNIANDNKHKNIIVYCWRGGMRSGTVVSFLGTLKLPLIQLVGGIRSYRKLVQAELEYFSTIEKQYIVLEGNTGTHKTDILEALQKENYPVLDLEGLAGHRGSTFGGIGLQPKSQKEFERDLVLRLRELQDSPYCIIEAESKRVGRIILPDFILKGKDAGVRIHIHSPIESRIKAICDTYQFENYHDEFIHAIEILKKRMKPNLYNQITESFNNRQYELFVKLILEEYYDPKYTFAADQYETPVRFVQIQGLEDGIEIVKTELNSIVKGMGLLTT
ncbi:tRNA 2-selenouridine(34) synthase MnmH [Schinkia azotoformans]|uniref:tRNA 2-selenouridine(34) synthase MnmH n=1 Tax=Schinkia azotoformans TaxID=1454 RepID=UPI002DBA1D25|nr:tRNA 2-selenouridine(34) synthase MnmH [Schinkia azotoformans]MEC1714625.1 tRNA 2-selenouridine(34) synthase MnmH [Schinkia azotoformans]MEC1742924.1 tRNA 2-selenouridine(34) synthase MnmH [Schinkia azotoformans]MEC1745399.1 tRNA 2-selenouridine(34) synthase MnmH [Schinkia azotoformans]MEC1757098.1 tRNA 2-selenouridine(34) synthase MnmH [Schinkia azotoformans]MEC1768321.1 tRNA 2-selenouridine(34) synthase MnmH [Schinkia azotoformans]